MSDDETKRDRPLFAQRYQVLGEVSRGGVGVISSASDPIIGRRVAIKALRRELSDDRRSLADFSQEARVTGQLDHPNIVPVYDFESRAPAPFMVMKLIAGKTLTEHLREDRGEPRSPSALRGYVQILIRVCEALSFAHSRGVTHCDVKPENVMVGDHGQVYLMDWGMALVKALDTSLDTPPRSRQRESSPPEPKPGGAVELGDASAPSGGTRGTPAYMAPEQVFGLIDEIDERTDVFGVGGILHELLTGSPPNNQRTLAGVENPGQAEAEIEHGKLWKHLPPELWRIARRALARSPNDRHQSIDELRLELEGFLLGGGWFDTLSFEAGQSIVTEGDTGDTAYAIESGECDVYQLSGGKRRRIRRLKPGDVFGEMAIFAGGKRTASVVAATRVSLKLITGASLNRELELNPWLRTVVSSLARLVIDKEKRPNVVPPSAADEP